jgi:type I restriction enzyme, S subunit
MRDGWVETPIGDVAQVLSGFAFKSELFNKSEGIPLIRIRDLPKRDSTEALYSGSYEDRYVVKKGDFLIGMDGEFHCYEWNGPDALLNQRVCRIQDFKIGRVVPRYIYFAVNQYLDKIEQDTGYTTVKHISAKQVLGITIPLPPLPEQKRIVDLISSVDSYIEALQHQLESAKRSRSAVLHELLTAGGDDWVETTLGNVCDFVNGDRGKNYPSAKFRQSHGIPFINAGHLDKGIVNFDSMDFISEEVFEKLGSGKIQPGDTLFCLRGSVGKFANVEDLQKGAIASSLVIIRPNSQITREFLMHYLDSDLCSSELKQSLTGAVQPNLSANNLKSFKISLPTLGKQIEIGDLLGQFNSSITAVSSLLESTRNLRSGILSDLLSGKHEIPASYDKVIGAA